MGSDRRWEIWAQRDWGHGRNILNSTEPGLVHTSACSSIPFFTYLSLARPLCLQKKGSRSTLGEKKELFPPPPRQRLAQRKADSLQTSRTAWTPIPGSTEVLSRVCLILELSLLLPLSPSLHPIAKFTSPSLPPPPRRPGRRQGQPPLPASKWQRGRATRSSPAEVKPQSLCPFPWDGWRSRPVATIMRLEFDREASNRKTYGVNLDAPRLAHPGGSGTKPRGPASTPRPSGPASQALAANTPRCAPCPAHQPAFGLRAGVPMGRTRQPEVLGQGRKTLARAPSPRRPDRFPATKRALAVSPELRTLGCRNLVVVSS